MTRPTTKAAARTGSATRLTYRVPRVVSMRDHDIRPLEWTVSYPSAARVRVERAAAGTGITYRITVNSIAENRMVCVVSPLDQSFASVEEAKTACWLHHVEEVRKATRRQVEVVAKARFAIRKMVRPTSYHHFTDAVGPLED